MTPAAPFSLHLVGISMPCSGHDDLATLLSLALGAEFFHCEYYTPLGCCRTVPCKRPRGARVAFQKNHDFDFSVPSDLPGVNYLVQHRIPVIAALSEREHLARVEGSRRAENRDEFVVWLGRKAAYVHRFWDKWMRPPRRGRMIIDYDVLLQRPISVLSELFGLLRIDLDPSALDRAVSEAGGRAVDSPAATGQAPLARVKTSPYFDEELLSIYESVVVGAVPECEPTRCLTAVAVEGHPVYLVYEAEMSLASGDSKAAAEYLAQATGVSADNAYLWHALSRAHLAAGDAVAAVAAAAEAVGRRPDHPEFVRALSDAHNARSECELSVAIETARELATLAPQEAGHLIHLASLLNRRREYAQAVDLAATVIELGPADPLVWREASEIFATVRHWASALTAVRGAILRDESNAEFHRHLGKLLAHADDPNAVLDDGLQQPATAWSLPPTRTDVRMAYRVLLGRDPESEEAVAAHAEGHADRAGLLRTILSSEEFAHSAMMTGPSLPLKLEQRAIELVATFAPPELKEPDSRFWTDALGVRTRCDYRSDWKDRRGALVRGFDGCALEWLALLETLTAAGNELCLVELGAGYGPWLVRGGLAWRRRHPDRPLQLLGIEGEPTHAAYLRQHAADNAIPSESLRLVEGAVTARDGSVEFEVAERPADEWGTRVATGRAPIGLPRVRSTRCTTVPSWSLATLTRDLGHIDLLHMDVQGSEEEIVAGSRDVLASKVSRLFVGTHSREAESSLIEGLPSLGFALIAETPCRYNTSGAVPILTLDGGQYWVNRRR